MPYIRSIYARCSPTVWLLALGRLVDMTTLWMAIPFMSLFVKQAGGSDLTVGLVLLGFAFSHSVWQLGILWFGNGLVNALYNPAYTAAIADATPPAGRAEAFSLSRVASNLGVGLGPLLGSMLGVGAQQLIFTLAAISSAAVATAFCFRLPETHSGAGVVVLCAGALVALAERERTRRLALADMADAV